MPWDSTLLNEVCTLLPGDQRSSGNVISVPYIYSLWGNDSVLRWIGALPLLYCQVTALSSLPVSVFDIQSSSETIETIV